MKRFFRAFFCVGLCSMLTGTLMGQKHTVCATPTTPSKWTEDYLLNRGIYQKSDDLLYVPLTIYIVGDDSGQGYASLKSVMDALCALNEDYVPANIQFFIMGDINYINRTIYYDHSQKSAGDRMYNEFHTANTLNCYIVLNAGGAAGYATSIGGAGVIISKSEMSSSNHTWGHEIGHDLGLYHPFYGWEGIEYSSYTDNTTPDRVSGRLVERVDESNCELAADGFCDTPPDYLSDRWDCDSDGKSLIIQKDPVGQTFTSDGTNIMSYSFDKCVTGFSGEQTQAMRTHLQTAKFSYLNRAQPVNSIDDLVANLTIPSKGESVDVNNVFLQWEPVPDATNYIIEVSRLNSFPNSTALTSTYLTNTNSITITDLDNNRTYYWRVKSFNRNSFCESFSSSSTFKTTTATAVNDIDKNTVFKIFPNPLPEDQSLTIQVNATTGTDLWVRLFDVSGKMIQSGNYRIIAGENTFSFVPGKVAKGLYLLNFTTDQGTSVKRIAIQ